MVKETAASYKLDFKHKFKDGPFKDRTFTITDFSRNRRYYNHASRFDYAVIAHYEQNNLIPENRNLTHEEMYIISDGSSLMAEAETAFQKWLLRREPVLNAWNDFLDYMSQAQRSYWDRQTNAPPPGSPITLSEFSRVLNKQSFRKMLETSRPYKLPIGSPVRIASKYINNYRYDPYYWGEHRNSPRVGTLIRYVDDISGKGGTGSRMIEVMFFADGCKKNIPERALELYSHQDKEQ